MINKLILLGRLGKDAEHREVSGGHLITFSVATSESYKDKNGQKVDNTEWTNCGYFCKSVGLAQYLKKGTLVYVEGKKETKEKDGKYYTGCSARKVQLIGNESKEQGKENVPF